MLVSAGVLVPRARVTVKHSLCALLSAGLLQNFGCSGVLARPELMSCCASAISCAAPPPAAIEAALSPEVNAGRYNLEPGQSVVFRAKARYEGQLPLVCSLAPS